MALAALLVLYRRRFSDMVDLTDVGDIYSRGVVDVDVGDITGGAVGCGDTISDGTFFTETSGGTFSGAAGTVQVGTLFSGATYRDADVTLFHNHNDNHNNNNRTHHLSPGPNQHTEVRHVLWHVMTIERVLSQTVAKVPRGSVAPWGGQCAPSRGVPPSSDALAAAVVPLRLCCPPRQTAGVEGSA